MRWVVPVFVIAAGAFFTVMGAVSYFHGRALLTRGVIIEAALKSTENRDSDSDTGHQVRYRFRVGGREFERVGIFGTGVSSDVTAETQAEAIASGHLAVRYLPDDPSINEPTAPARRGSEKGAIAMGIGLVMLLGGFLRLVLAR
jgi:hypothetical protein